jgi:hypothetical protein
VIRQGYSAQSRSHAVRWPDQSSRRVDVAPAAQQRRQAGEHGQSGRDAEHDHQAVVKRSGDEAGEELVACDGLLGAGRELGQRAA